MSCRCFATYTIIYVPNTLPLSVTYIRLIRAIEIIAVLMTESIEYENHIKRGALM